MKWSKYLGAAVVALAMGWGGSANALLITAQNASTTSGMFDVTCGLCNSNTPSQTLTGTVSFDNFVFSNGGSTLSTSVTVNNTTPVNPITAGESITAFAFNTIPDASTVTDTSTFYNTVTEDNFPGFNTVDVCETAQGQGSSCAGGSNGGLFSGQSETFTLTFNGISPTGSFDIGTDIAGGTETVDFKFAGSMGSFEGSGGLTGCVPGAPGCVTNPPTTVPEPGSLVLMGTALVGLWGASRFMRRRKGYVGGGFAA